jgi:ribosome-associated protein
MFPVANQRVRASCRPSGGVRVRKEEQPLTSALQPGSAAKAADQVPRLRSIPVPDTYKQVLKSLEDAKAEDIVSIDITGKSPLSDHMVVASGRSHRHVGAIAERLIGDLKHGTGVTPRVEGLPNCDWVLIDAGDVIVHVFRPEVRSFYNLEKMWQVDAVAAPQIVRS